MDEHSSEEFVGESEDSSSLDDPTPTKRVKLGTKINPDSSTWKKNVQKQRRASGKCYLKTTKDGEVITKGKKFTVITSCCPKKCFSNVTAVHQEMLFDNFYALGSKANQDLYLSGCMYDKDIKSRRTNVTAKPIVNLWEYNLLVPEISNRILVCRQFLLSIFQVTARRFRTIQNKLKTGSIDFTEKRGTHNNRPHKIEDDVWSLIKEHWSSMPNTPSHYSAKKSKRLYFDNTELSITKLHDMFKLYYNEKTGKNLSLKYKTYFKYFKTHSPYSFRKPRTDTCDFCEKTKMKIKVNPDDQQSKNMMRLHETKVAGCKSVKQDILKNAETDEYTLVLEFDYGQNLPLPQLTVNAVFYKRLLWYYVFNVHCHNDNESTMYTYLETEGSKDPDTVASFLFDVIRKKIEQNPNIKEIILLSDNCGGQNKNFKMMTFCSFIAVKFQVNVLQLFPVRGHSYCQCDRNFGSYSKSIHRRERITTTDQYDAIIRSKATVTPGYDLMKKWSAALVEYFKEYKKICSKGVQFKIQQYCRIKYTSSGNVLAASTYFGSFTPYAFLIRGKSFEDFQVESVQHLKRIPLKQAKENDLRALYPFLSPDECEWFNNVIENPKEQNMTEEAVGAIQEEAVGSEVDDVSDYEAIMAYEFP